MGRVFALRNVRVFYAKRGRMKYVSHLDMNRYMVRLFKVANIPAWYTEGFSKEEMRKADEYIENYKQKYKAFLKDGYIYDKDGINTEEKINLILSIINIYSHHNYNNHYNTFRRYCK